MTTAEKRAALEVAGKPWPECECHGVAMLWQRDPSRPNGGRFRCRPAKLAWRQRRRAERLEAGECQHCGDPLDTATMCQPCADKHADLMNSPQQYLKHRARLADYRAQAREAEGFRSTGIGLAAFAAWTDTQPGR